MSLLFAQVSHGDENNLGSAISHDELSLVKRTCDSTSFSCDCCYSSQYCLYNLGVPLECTSQSYVSSTILLSYDCLAFSLISEQPCGSGGCLTGVCKTFNDGTAGCVLEPVSPNGYNAAATSTTSDEGSQETSSHHSSSTKSMEQKSKKLPPKVISGIVVGVLAFFTAVGGAITWLFRRRKRASASSAHAPSAPYNPPGDYRPSPEYFKSPEAQVSPVSDPSPMLPPQKY